MEGNLEPNNEVNNKISEKINESNSGGTKELESEKINNKEKEVIKKNENDSKNIIVSKDNENVDNPSSDKTMTKPKKELPIEKKPFHEFITNHLTRS